MAQITGGRGDATPNVLADQATAVIHDILEHVVRDGESNSIVLTGPVGSGKRTLVDRCLATVTAAYGTPTTPKPFLLIRLRGLVEADARASVVAIVRQLHLEQQITEIANVAFAEALHTILALIKQGNDRAHLPLVFVVEDISAFADQPRQMLLYNLFDLVQSRAAPLVLIGTDIRTDFVESLEKRVKSRFSHRMVSVPAATDSVTFLDRVRKRLCVPEPPAPGAGLALDPAYAAAYNASVRDALEHGALRATAMAVFSSSQRPHDVWTACIPSVLALSPQQPLLTVTAPSPGAGLHALSALPTMLPLDALAPLESVLLLAARYLAVVHQCADFSFEMVHHIYKTQFLKLRRANMAVWRFKKAVVRKAFDRLVLLELIGLSDAAQLKQPKAFRLYAFMFYWPELDAHYLRRRRGGAGPADGPAASGLPGTGSSEGDDVLALWCRQSS